MARSLDRTRLIASIDLQDFGKRRVSRPQQVGRALLKLIALRQDSLDEWGSAGAGSEEGERGGGEGELHCAWVF